MSIQTDTAELLHASTVPSLPARMKILIIEDDNTLGVLIRHALERLKVKFPDAEIIHTISIEEAREVYNALPYPDVAIVDLVLGDSTMEQTIAELDLIEARCPAIIMSGYSPEMIRARLKGRKIEIVEKGSTNSLQWIDTLSATIGIAISRWWKQQDVKWKEKRLTVDRNIKLLQELTDGAYKKE